MASDELIGSDSLFSVSQRATLEAVLDLIVPPAPERGLPGASAVDVYGHLRDQVAVRSGAAIREIAEHLESLEAAAHAHHARSFAELPNEQAALLVDQLRAQDSTFLARLAVETVTCYYVDDRVMTAIGMEPRAPYPKGFSVESGDLSLLDPVVARGKRYRDAR